MSNVSRNASRPDRSSYMAGLRRRLPYYAVVAVLVILTLAYIDAGEEPIRPITQIVAMPGGATESE